MKLLFALCALSLAAFADVQMDKPASSGSVTVSVRPYNSALQVFVRSSDSGVSRFRVTAVVVVNGAAATISGTANRYPDNIPGTYWTTFLIESPGAPERVVSVNVEEMRATEFR
jgi:hypothetical protein